MPDGQKGKVSNTYVSSWGKNAEFNFAAVDAIFKDLTADAKMDYLFDRLHYNAGITEDTVSVSDNYVTRNAKKIMELSRRIMQRKELIRQAVPEQFSAQHGF